MDRNLQLRILTALSLGLGFVGAIYISAYAAIALFAIILVIGLFELFYLIRSIDAAFLPHRTLTIWLSLCVFGILAIMPGFLRLDMLFPRDYFLALGILFTLILILFGAELFRNKPKPLENIAFGVFGVAYLAIPFGLIISSSFDSEGNYQAWHILYFFFFMWASDPGAYFAGRFFGKHNLFERLSPKKTIEGFIGGILASGLMGWAAFSHLGKFGLIEWIAIGVQLASTGTAGDLFESMPKRQAGIKDRGNIRRGHGAILNILYSA